MFNPFKKEKKPVREAKAAKKPEAATEEKKTTRAETVKAKGRYSFGILISPRITEKAARLTGEANQYVFEVADRANAVLVKEAVEGKYGVRVRKVNMLKSPGKKVRLGRQMGWSKGFKKAIVTLEKGQSIELT